MAENANAACVNVRPCPRPLCGEELCDTHQAECVYCALHDLYGYPLPQEERQRGKRSLAARAHNLIEFKIIRATICRVFGHRWWSMPVVGHAGGPIIYYSNMCRRCYGPSVKSDHGFDGDTE